MKDRKICFEHFADKELLEEIEEMISNDDRIGKLSKLYKALGDPTRLKIVYVLSKSELCVCDIALLLEMTQSSISHHLRVLRDLNLVKFRREGKLVIYSLDDDHVVRLFKEGLDHINHLYS